jgi:hypothetical protein
MTGNLDSLSGMGGGGGGGDTLVAQAESNPLSTFNMGSGPIDKTVALVVGVGALVLFGLIIVLALAIPKRKEAH